MTAIRNVDACPVAPPRLLNLGCGARFHPAWTNLDLHPADPAVRRHDLTAPLPLPNGSFDGVYHAHVLEHLRPADGVRFLHECWRVLRPGGVLRVVVPDLEGIARLYLDALDRAWPGDPAAGREHRWLVLELYDQATRERPGGAMLDTVREEPIELAWYRLGVDGHIIRQHLQRPPCPTPRPSRLRGWRERLVRWLLGREYELLQVGRFRRGGEVHQTMYDRVSLRRLVADAGFVEFRCVGPGESAIPGWLDYHLDTEPDGAARKPDSLYVEARKP